MPIYGKKRKRVGQTNKPSGKPAPMPTKAKKLITPKPSTGGVMRGSKRKRLPQTSASGLKPTPGGGVYRGHKNIKRVPKKKTTPGGPKNPRIGGEKYTVGK